MWIKAKNLDIVLQILLFIAVMGFMNQGINIMVLVCAAVIAVDRWKLHFSGGLNTFYLLCAFAVAYLGITALHDIRGLVAIGFPIAFYLGIRAGGDSEKQVKHMILLLGFGMACHVLLNFGYEIFRFGLSTLTNSRHYDIWSGKLSTATGIMVNGSILTALLFYFLYYEKQKKLKFAGLAVLLIMTAYDLALGGRTFLVLSVLSILVGLIMSVSMHGISRRALRRAARFLFATAVFVLLGLVVYLVYREEFHDFFESSYFYHRFFRSNAWEDIFKTERIETKLFYIAHMPDYLWGGGELNKAAGSYAHELWLDIYDQAGVIPYALIMVYTITSVVRAFKTVRKKELSDAFRIVVGAFYLILLAQFFVEPVMAGAPLLAYSYCIVDGMICSMLKRKNIGA